MELSVAVSLSLTLASLIQQVSPEPFQPVDFSQSCAVWAQGNNGSCVYIFGNVYVTMPHLRQALMTETHKEKGVELLTSDATPLKCIAYLAQPHQRQISVFIAQGVRLIMIESLPFGRRKQS